MYYQHQQSYYFFYRQHLLFQVLLIFFITRAAFSNPVANPDISAKSVNKAMNNVNDQQSNQQQQQSLQQNMNQQDTHLNSLNAYATNFDTIAPNSPQLNFKPSYKLPEMETNFTPIQTGQSPDLPTADAPLLMHYIPQTLHEGGVQYLQLIPTRPLIVPIGPYINANSQAPSSNTYQQSIQSPNTFEIHHHNHSPAMIKSIPVNGVSPLQSTLADVSLGLPFNLHNPYTNPMQPFRNNFRFHREIRDKHLAPAISLNLNEYVPGQMDAPKPSYFRGRP